MPMSNDFRVGQDGAIRHLCGTTRYPIPELRRYLLNVAPDAVSEKGTENLLVLNVPYNIDDEAARFLVDGTVHQDGGMTVYANDYGWDAVDQILETHALDGK